MRRFAKPRLAVVALAALLIPAAASAQWPIIGYYPSWSGDISSVQFKKLTHINYSFGNTDAAGNISISNEQRLWALVDQAHSNNVRVGLAIGGWAAGTAAFEQMAANATARANFIAKAVALCEDGLDGIDMDWEYPNAGSAANYALLMRELGAALKAKGKYLSAAVIADGDYFGQHFRSSVFESLDYMNIMSYDATDQAHHSSYEKAVSSFDYWVTRRKLPKHKAILGVPFYGRSINGGDRYVSYKEVVAGNASLAQSDTHEGLYYNGIPTIVKKTDLAWQKGGGIMIWELSQDAPGANSLLSAIHTKAMTFPATAIRPARGAEARLALAGPGLLRFVAPAAGRYTLRLRHLSGRLAGGASETAAAGMHELRFDAGALTSGAYVAEIIGGGAVRSVPVLIP